MTLKREMSESISSQQYAWFFCAGDLRAIQQVIEGLPPYNIPDEDVFNVNATNIKQKRAPRQLLQVTQCSTIYNP